MSDAAMPDSTHVGRTALVVSDLDELVGFYRDVVGLALVSRDDRTATLGAGGTPLLHLRADPSAAPRSRQRAGLFHTAVRVPDRAALGDALGRIRTGWHLSGASDHHVSEALYLRDPEGNGLEIYRDRPREDWPTTDAGRVAMATLPLDLDALAAAAGGAAGVPDGTDVGHVHLEVTDLAAARRFYVDGLGLQVRQEWGDEALFVAAGGYHHHVGLNTWNGRTAPRDPAERGLDWFELVLPDADALDAVVDRLAGAGVAVSAVSDGAGVAVRDPDGIEVRLQVGFEEVR